MTRGDIYRVRLPRQRGREHAGPRYAVVVQAEALLGLSTVIVAPTSRAAAAATFRPEIEIAGERTRVLVEQLRAIDIDRLDRLAGRVNAHEQGAIDQALALTPDLCRRRPRVAEHRGFRFHAEAVSEARRRSWSPLAARPPAL